MSYTVQILPEATQEVGEIYEYYDKIGPGLGDRFLSALSECYHSLERMPKLQKRKAGFRHALVERFPYRVVYEIHGSIVIVYQVRHMSRRPHARFGP